MWLLSGTWLHIAILETFSDALHDRLVRGLRDETTQKRLLSEASLTLTEAIAIFAGYREQVRKLKSPSQAAGDAVGSVMRGGPSSPKLGGPGKATCHHCGRSHPRETCRFKDATCHRCGKRGHIALVCRSKKRERKPSGLQFRCAPYISWDHASVLFSQV